MTKPYLEPQKSPVAVVFDWDNTLVDTMQVSYKALCETLTHFKKSLPTFQEFLKMPQHAIRHDFAELFKERAEVAEKFFIQAILRLHEDETRPMPGAEKLLHYLKGRGIYMAVASNKNGGLLRKEVAALSWEDFFSRTIGSYDTPEDKPSALPLLEALRGGPQPGQDVWFVGDAAVDTLCAHNAGCLPVSFGEQAIVEDVPSVKGIDCPTLLRTIKNLP